MLSNFLDQKRKTYSTTIAGDAGLFKYPSVQSRHRMANEIRVLIYR